MFKDLMLTQAVSQTWNKFCLSLRLVYGEEIVLYDLYSSKKRSRNFSAGLAVIKILQLPVEDHEREFLLK